MKTIVQPGIEAIWPASEDISLNLNLNLQFYF